jgi:hypothetical protein
VDLVLLAVILVVDVFVVVPGREITVTWMLTSVLLHLIFVVLIRRASTQMVAMSVTVDLGTRKCLLITVFLVQVRNYYLPLSVPSGMPEKHGSVTGNRGRQRQQMTTIPENMHL